ncbi:NYN domain-containing protein [Sinomonas soli]
MAGTCRLARAEVTRVQSRINWAVPPNESDHTVIASSHHNAAATYFGWAGSAQRLARSGKDGADTALIEAVSDTSWIAGRYDNVVVASGDHIFAPAVAALKAAGTNVIVISPDSGLSHRMRLAAGPDLVRLEKVIPSKIVSMSSIEKDAA